MGRKRRRRAARPSLSTSNIFDQLITGMSEEPTGNLGMDLSAEEVADSLSSRRRGILETWFFRFIDIMESFPLEVTDDRYYGSKGAFEIDGVHADGTITGTYEENDQLFDLLITHKSGEVPARCSCIDARGERPCKHQFQFLDYITDKLDNRRSPLAQRLLQQNFHKGQPDLGRFKFDDRAQIQHLLDRLPIAEVDLDDAQLPPVKEASDRRIAWNISIAHETISIYPMLQQAKKRGGGYTKGRKIKLDDLSSYHGILAAHDNRIRDLIEFDTSYYRVVYTLDPIAAIELLIGQPNVLLDGDPIEVRRSSVTLTIKKDYENCWLALKGLNLGEKNFFYSRENFVHFRRDVGRIEICQMRAEQVDLAVACLRLPPIPLKYENDLLQRVQKLRGSINFETPEDVAGPIVDDLSTPVVLLRSHPNGSLDYGIRVRDGGGKLRLPCQGLMVQEGRRDGKPVQLRRNTDHENRLLREVTEHLRLTKDSIDGSIDDFEQSLQFIGRLQELEASGTEILWDKSSSEPIRMLGSMTASNVSVGIKRKRDWFQLDGKCELGDESIELAEVLGALQDADEDSIRGDYVRIGSRGWTKIAKSLKNQLTDLRDSIHQERRTLKFDATSAPAIEGLLQAEVQVDASKAWHDCLSRMRDAETLEPVLPTNLDATLRDYQVEGYQWLRRLAEWGVGGILADDMGLGKTLQTLAVILDRSAEGPTLVIAPTSVGFNWVREAERFTPDLDVQLYRETDRANFLTTVGPGSLVVCSYGLALRDARELAGVSWSTMVLDEAQAIKNSRSKTSLAIANIPSDWRVALTGTPVENHLGELWSLFHVISPGVFGGWEQFRKRFAAPIEKENKSGRRMALQHRLKPFVLRRTKSEVLKDLPPRTEMNIHVELSVEERAMYDKVRMSAVGEIDAIAKVSDSKDQRFKILALLTRLRQISCSPRIVHDTWTERSSKLIQLQETLTELHEEGHRVLIFSQFVQHLALIREMLDEEAITYEYLDGSTPANERQTRVDRFQEGDATAFLISLKAGGTGLNLTAADYVIHMDPWWNPAVEDQATDRAHRIGQDKPVMVYRLIAQGTIEEEILKLHETKRDLVSGIMEGTHAAGKLSTSDLIALVRGE